MRGEKLVSEHAAKLMFPSSLPLRLKRISLTTFSWVIWVLKSATFRCSVCSCLMIMFTHSAHKLCQTGKRVYALDAS